MEVTEPPREVLTLQTPAKTEERSLQSLSVSRFTRSKVAPDWTIKEMQLLVNEFAAVNNHDLRKLPSCQKWKMISQNMADENVSRPANQCQRKWESLLSDYRKIKGWELQPGTAAFWSLDNESKKDLGLPAFFDQELFSYLDSFLLVQKSQFVSEVDSGLEKLPKAKAKRLAGGGTYEVDGGFERRPKVKVKHLAIKWTSGMAACLSHSCFHYCDVPYMNEKWTFYSGLESLPKVKVKTFAVEGTFGSKKEACGGTQTGDDTKEQEIAKKLEGSTQLVQEILGRQFTESMSNGGPPDLNIPLDPKIEFVRQQADELIRVFETLVDNLQQFTELVKGSGE